MNAKTYGRPVIPILIAYVIGLAGGAGLPGLGKWIWGLAGLFLAALIHKIGRRQHAAVVPLVFSVLCGYLAIQPWLAPDLAENHVSRFTGRHLYRISGIVTETSHLPPKRTRLGLKVTGLEKGPETIAVQGRVRVTVYGRPPAVEVGDAVAFNGRLRATRNFNNPGAFDYRTYMALKGLRATAYTTTDKLQVFPRKTFCGFKRRLERLRYRIAQQIDSITTHSSSAAGKAVLKALIIGERSGMTPEWRLTFNRSGVGHLLAISGLHIGIIAATAFWLGRWLLAHWRGALQRAWVTKGAAVLTLIPVVAYGLLAGLSPSTQRAVIMIGVFLLAVLIERDQDLLNTLCVAALIILLLNPPALFSISFQLSFTAVAAILLGLSLRKQKVHQTEKSYYRRIISGLQTTGQVSLLATIGTLPLIMHYFNLVSVVGWGVNIVVVPVVGFTVIPLGLLAVAVGFCSPAAASVLWKLCLAVLSKMLALIQFIAAWPWAAVRTVTPSGIEIACYYVLLASLYLIALARSDPQAVQARRWGRWGRHLLIAALLVAGMDVGYWTYQRFGRSDLEVTVIDVGQGSATLVETPGGHTVLVDGGGFGDNSVFDVGARIVAPLLWRKKIRTVETLVLSHPNSDHLNGLLFIAENFNVKELWTNGETADNAGYRELMRVLRRTSIDVPVYEDLIRHRVISGVRFDILYPPPDYLLRCKADAWRNSNNNSMVLKISYGQRSLLLPGDIMAQGEAELVRLSGALLKSCVMLAPHHGSRTSSSRCLLAQVKPQFIVISAGWQNRFGFPDPAVLDRYRAHGCRIWRTDRQGAVTIVTDGARLEISSWLSFTNS